MKRGFRKGYMNKIYLKLKEKTLEFIIHVHLNEM